MLLVSDSGSTKADWKFGSREADVCTTKGFNPFFHDAAFVLEELASSPLARLADQITELRFFGAGCSSLDRNEQIAQPLSIFFPNAHVVVDHDILGAAIATNFDDRGITCIIGTGSNSCYYDGTRWSQVVPALGYLLGDEASGSWLGRRLLADYLYHLLPECLEQELKMKGLTKEGIFHSAYHEPHVNVYFASMARVLSTHSTEPYVRQLVRSGFEEFLRIHILRYDQVHELPLHFVGSIAFYFREILEEVLLGHRLICGKILRKPIHELYRYYQEKGL